MKKTLLVLLVTVFMFVGVVHAGMLTPPAGSPYATSYTLADLYNKLGNLSYNPPSHSLSGGSTPSPTFYSLTDIYNRLLSQTANIIPQNIRSGVTIMGVIGTYSGTSTPTSLTWSGTFPWVNVVGSTKVYQSGFGPYRGLCWSSMSYEINTARCLTIQVPPYSGARAGGFYDASVNQDGSIKLGAKEYCDYLYSDGTTLATTPQHIWRLPSVSELYSKMADSVLNGSPEPSSDSFGGFRNGVYWSNDLSPINYYTYTPSGSYDSARVVGFTVYSSTKLIAPGYQPRESHSMFRCVKP